MSNYIVSYGGGVDSTAMIIWLIKNKKPIDYVVFSDTGNEVPETYEFIEKHMIPYLNRYGIKFVVVYPFKKRSLYTRCWKREVFPDTHHRWCTRDVKITPIHKFYKKLKGKIFEYMGIAYDDIRRMKPALEDYIEKIYPLVDNKLTRELCVAIIIQGNLPLPVKSGCFFCCYNTKERWDWLEDAHPELYKLAQQLEERSKHFKKSGKKLIKNGIGSSEVCDGMCMT